MKVFCVLDPQGFSRGFYNEDVHGAQMRPVFGDTPADGSPPPIVGDEPNPDCKIPAEAVEISSDDWREYLANQGRRRWVDGILVEYMPPGPTVAQLIAYANGVQWQKATGGYVVMIAGEPTPFSTSGDAMSLMNGKVARLEKPDPPAAVNWQVGPAEFKAIAPADFIAASIEIADFVQSTFDALPAVFAMITARTITTTAEIDAAFA